MALLALRPSSSSVRSFASGERRGLRRMPVDIGLAELDRLVDDGALLIEVLVTEPTGELLGSLDAG